MFKDLSCPISEADEVALLTQHVNEKLFERIVSQQATVEPSEVEVPPLTENEANALRYAAGYVPFALKQKLYIPVLQGPLSFLSNWLAVCAPVLVYVGWRDLKLVTDLHLYAGDTGQLGAARICSGH